MSIDRDVAQQARGRKAGELLALLDEFRVTERERIIKVALEALDANQLVGTSSLTYWVEIRALDALFGRIRKEIHRGEAAGGRTASMRPPIGLDS